MTTSGSYNFTVSRNEIINLASEIAGIKGQGNVLSAGTIASLGRLLDLIVKQWMGKADFAPGLKVWSRKRAYLFPQTNTSSYSLGPSGDHFTASYTSTTMRVAGSATDTTLEVTSTTGMTANDYIGIILDDDSIHWTTISSVTDSDTVVIASGLASAAAIGNTIYFYTTKAPLPLEIISLRRRDTSNNETVIHPMSLNEYEEGVLNKAEDSDPVSYLYERGITNGTLFLDSEPVTTTDIYRVTYLRPMEDFDSATDTPDYPQEWYRALVGQLAMDACIWRGMPVTPEMKLYRDEALGIAGNVDPDTSELFFQSET